MASDQSNTRLEAGDRVRVRGSEFIGTVSKRYSRDWANMTDEDVMVEWDDAELGVTAEAERDLELADLEVR